MTMPIARLLREAAAAEQITILQDLFQQEAIDDAAVIEVVRSLRQSTDPGLRFWARKVFARHGKPEAPAVPLADPAGTAAPDVLLAKLRDVRESTFVAVEVLTRLLKQQDPQTLPALLEYLKQTPDPFQISFMTRHLGQAFPNESLLPELIPFLRHSDERVVANTIEGIEAIGSPKGIPLFSQLLRHSDSRVKAAAARALCKYDVRKTFRILSAMLHVKGQSHFAISACHAIRTLKDPRYVPGLLRVVPDPAVTDDALAALKEIGGDEVAAGLATLAGELAGCQAKITRTLGDIYGVQKEREREARPRGWRPEWLVIALLLLVVVAAWWPAPGGPARQALRERGIPWTLEGLHAAIASDSVETVALFVDGGFDVDALDGNGENALHRAASLGRYEVAKRLMSRRHDPANASAAQVLVRRRLETRSRRGETALLLAARAGSVETVNGLLEAGADKNAQDDQGNSVLHAAVAGGNERVVLTLANHGVDTAGKNARGNTALHEAVLAKNRQIAYWLKVFAKADPDLRNAAGVSARDLGLDALLNSSE